jgi:hypothetical protein
LYKLYASNSVYPLGVDQEIFLILSWGKASDQIKNTSLLLRSLPFWLLGYLAPSVCITKPDVPDLEIDQKKMIYVEIFKMKIMYLY